MVWVRYTQLRDWDWVYQKYWIEGLNIREIAEELGCTREHAQNKINELGMPTRSGSESQKGIEKRKKWPEVYNAEWLEEKYINEKLSIQRIADIAGCNYETVRRGLIKANIPRRSDTEKNNAPFHRYPNLYDKDWLRKNYIEENRSQREIASILSCNQSSVRSALEFFNFFIRKGGNKNRKYPEAYDKDFLWQRYVVEKKTLDEIAKELGCHNTIVLRGLKQCGIPRRTREEFMDEDYKRKDADRTRALWKDKDYVKSVFDGLNTKPNKFEQRIDRIIQNSFLNEWAYNGDFSEGIMIGGKIPDFVNVNGRKQVIECFGDPYHDGTFNSSWKRTEFGTKAIYNQVGFSCLVLWFSECEKKTDEQIAEEVKQFMEREK